MNYMIQVCYSTKAETKMVKRPLLHTVAYTNILKGEKVKCIIKPIKFVSFLPQIEFIDFFHFCFVLIYKAHFIQIKSRKKDGNVTMDNTIFSPFLNFIFVL